MSGRTEVRSGGIVFWTAVVSMRLLTPAQVIEAVVITSRYPQAHGTPVHSGDPRAIGISHSAS
jgi:uncharacterized protein YcsI (UPF0317 family)